MCFSKKESRADMATNRGESNPKTLRFQRTEEASDSSSIRSSCESWESVFDLRESKVPKIQFTSLQFTKIWQHLVTNIVTYNHVFERIKTRICTLHISTFFDVTYNARFHVFKHTIVIYG